MAYGHASDVIVGIKPEATYNTAPGTGSAERLRIRPSPGMSLTKNLSPNDEVSLDAQTRLARHGTQSVPGSYNLVWAVDAQDTVIEAVMRSTWVAAVAITQATMTSITTTTSTIVAAAGSWLTQGVRKGDVVRLTGHSTAANNSINLLVAGVTTLTITLVGTPLTADAVADTSFTLTILRKIAAATTPTRRTFYVDEYEAGAVDVSTVFGGTRFTGLALSGSADGKVEASTAVLGASATALATGSSPYYITPSETTTLPLEFVDARVIYNGTASVACTAFDLNYSIEASTKGVAGTPISPDIFDGKSSLSGSLTFLREDLTHLTQFSAETTMSLHLLFVEPETEPKDCISIFVGYITLTGANRASDLGAEGAAMVSVPWTAGVPIGVPATTGLDNSLMTICTSAA